MIEFGVKGAELIAVNTDKQALFLSKADQKNSDRRKAYKGSWVRSGPGYRP